MYVFIMRFLKTDQAKKSQFSIFSVISMSYLTSLLACEYLWGKNEILFTFICQAFPGLGPYRVISVTAIRAGRRLILFTVFKYELIHRGINATHFQRCLLPQIFKHLVLRPNSLTFCDCNYNGVKRLVTKYHVLQLSQNIFKIFPCP